ncbi:apolipoprotein C-III isoform X2 [Phyllobates terribilis]|uniref:apolipoprotein C-III isoform X2 n=1 Tax=Phyllobates terribilis TaxID=111132 RepID=UPI003CCB1374
MLQSVKSYGHHRRVSSSSRTLSDLALQPSPLLCTPLLLLPPFSGHSLYNTSTCILDQETGLSSRCSIELVRHNNLNMKLLVISALLVLAVCAASAEEETFLSSTINYVQDLASDVATKTTDALNQVKEMPLAQQAIGIYDSGSEYVSSVYSSIFNTAIERWEQLTKSF